ncbi:MAG: hypothetical protein B7Y42_16070, partial [Polaromonas sp. 28-63-22]
MIRRDSLKRSQNRDRSAARRQGTAAGQHDHYAAMHQGFRWQVDEHFNIATAVAYMAVFQMGAVAMPLSMLFGPEALQYRLHDSEAVVAVCDDSSIASVQAVRAECPALRKVLAVGVAGGDVAYESAVAAHQTAFPPVQTRADDAAILIYTSGTTGPPKGALLAHRALIGNLPGFVCSQNWFGFDPYPEPATPSPVRGRAGVGASPSGARPSKGLQNTSVFWSPADWAWTGGLMDALLPTLYFGRPIVAFNGRFTPELAFTLMQQHGVTHTFLFPTALKAMMKAYPRPRDHFALKLEGLMSAGEAVGDPGHRVAVIDDDGKECAVGVSGDVAVNRFDLHGDPDPIFFLGYWKKDAATQAKFTGDWCRTGDLARRDADGYL